MYGTLKPNGVAGCAWSYHAKVLNICTLAKVEVLLVVVEHGDLLQHLLEGGELGVELPRAQHVSLCDVCKRAVASCGQRGIVPRRQWGGRTAHR